MIFVVDVGNTSILAGFYRNNTLVKQWRKPTEKINEFIRQLPKKKIEGAVVSSVVPRISQKLLKSIKKRYSIIPCLVSHKTIRGIKIKLKHPEQVGADRLVNALSAFRQYNRAVIIVDFGTATTICAVNKKGEYLGGVIIPGINLALNSLHEHTAKLPRVTFKPLKKMIGKNTREAMQSGIFNGYIALINGMLKAFKKEISEPVLVVATGGLAGAICRFTPQVDIINPNLTIEGLKIVWEDMHV
jgi:type III pantothenate kinase